MEDYMISIDIVTKERKRQVEELGYTPTKDIIYNNSELSAAAACYAMPQRIIEENYGYNYTFKKYFPVWWPWDVKFYKPTPNNRMRELTKACALLLAEMDLIRLKEQLENGVKEG